MIGSYIISRLRPFGRLLPLLLLVGGCKKEDDPTLNKAPETEIAIKEINLTGENRLNSLVRLRWWGSDPDGFVDRYELSFDQQNWQTTEVQDSVFQFVINAGSDTVDIDFWVRAIDNAGATDPTPAYLKIPLKNTPPEILLNEELFPEDTAFVITSMTWDASDLDGFETLESIQLSINGDDWVSMPRTKTFASIVPDDPKASGAVTAKIIYDDGSEGPSINGLQLGASNTFYLRALDIAGSVSISDTSSAIVVTNQSEDFLVIGANASMPNAFYGTNLQSVGASYDFIDMMRASGKNQPKIWAPTFSLLLSLYDQVLIYSDASTLTNAQTSSEGTILEFAATSIQKYSDDGGKLMITTSFPNDLGISSTLFGVLPMDSLSTSEGQARLAVDSLAEGQSGFPDLVSSSFIVGLDPIYPSTDASVLYTAQLTRNAGWVGPDIVAVRRQNNGNTNFIFFSLELHRMNNDPTAMESLFDKIFNEEFNW